MGGALVKLQVDTQCVGHGRCYTLAPQLLTCDDEGYVTIRGGDPIEVPDGMEELARDVEGSCPESAITVTDG
jgi:ferredoxin